MAHTSKRGVVRVVGAGVAGVLLLGPSPAPVKSPAAAQQSTPFEFFDVGSQPRLVTPKMLLGMEPIRAELMVTEARTREQEAVLRRRIREILQALGDRKDAAKLQANLDVISRENDTALQATLTPQQRARLDQIQIQAEGPLAFTRPEVGPFASPGQPLARRLKLSADQIRQCQAIIDEGRQAIVKAARSPIALSPKDGPTTVEAIRRPVGSPEYQAAKQEARRAGRAANAAVIRRIEAILTEEQRHAYRELVGPPFELSKLLYGRLDERENDIRILGGVFGPDRGRRTGPGPGPGPGRP